MRFSSLVLLIWSTLVSSTTASTVGVYLASPSRERGGVFVTHLDTQTGQLSPPTRIAEAKTSFLARHPTKQLVYGVGGDQVRAFATEGESKNLRLLNEQPSGGRGPAHVNVDHAGRNALIANYGGGSVAVVPIKPDGSLAEPSAVVAHTGSGPNPKRQQEPHPHSVNFDPRGNLVLVADLGLDQIKLYQLDAKAGTLTPADPPHISTPSGGGPRHLDFHPNGKFLYVNNEMGCSITAYRYDGAGRFAELQTITTLIRPPTEADTTSEIQVHPTGKFLYVANRGPDEIASFSIDQSTGQLTPLGHTPTEGKTPRHFAIDPTGQWLLVANQNGDNVVVLKIDHRTGALSPTGHAVQLDQPMCVLFDP